MDTLRYPNLVNMAQNEGACPICLMEMRGQIPKYQCENGHIMCHRCKPYYYGCPTCHGHLSYIPPADMDAPYSPPPIHLMPHPMPMPTAPEMDFIENERRNAWCPPPPQPDQNLVRCRYAKYGCWINVPEYLKEIHETRCQFRPYLEEEHLPTDLPFGNELVPCSYSIVGCNVTMPPWRQPIHEPLCIFKERYEALNNGEEVGEPEPEAEGEEDPDELVECKLKIYGCLVKMPRRRKVIHEQKCNYMKYYKDEDFEQEPEPEEEPDPDSLVDCCWAEHGCRIRPKLHRKETHEEKCNYKMEQCSFKDNGCEETFLRARRFAHERTCEFRE